MKNFYYGSRAIIVHMDDLSCAGAHISVSEMRVYVEGITKDQLSVQEVGSGGLLLVSSISPLPIDAIHRLDSRENNTTTSSSAQLVICQISSSVVLSLDGTVLINMEGLSDGWLEVAKEGWNEGSTS